MRRAAALARIGYGNTYPNPAVGCVIVRPDANGDDDDVVVGFGFHPRAGWPHAEVFALLEACGHVDNGVAAARSVMRSSPPSDDNHHDGASTAGGGIAASRLLLDAYASMTNGPAALFGGRLDGANFLTVTGGSSEGREGIFPGCGKERGGNCAAARVNQ